MLERKRFKKLLVNYKERHSNICKSKWFKIAANINNRRSPFMKLYDPYNVCFSYNYLDQKSKCGSPSKKAI